MSGVSICLSPVNVTPVGPALRSTSVFQQCSPRAHRPQSRLPQHSSHKLESFLSKRAASSIIGGMFSAAPPTARCGSVVLWGKQELDSRLNWFCSLLYFFPYTWRNLIFSEPCSCMMMSCQSSCDPNTQNSRLTIRSRHDQLRPV